MTTIRRQSLFSLVFIYAGFLIGGINILYFFPKYFTTEQFGLTRLLLEFALLLSALCSSGMVPVSVKFFPFHKKYLPNRKNDLLFLTLSVNLIALAVMLIALPLLKPYIIRKFSYRSPLFQEYYQLLYPLTIGMTLFSLYEGYAWITRKTVVSNFLREFLFRFITTLLILGWAMGAMKDFSTFVTLFSYSYIPLLLILVGVISRTREYPLVPAISPVTRRLAPKMASFGLAFFASSVLNALARTNDTIILASQSTQGLTDIAVFNVATYLITLMDVPQRSLVSAATPQIAIAWKDKNYTRLSSIYNKTALNLLIIGLALIGVILLNVDELIVFLGPKYAQIGSLVLILGTAKIIDLGTGLNSQILMLSKHWKIDLFSNMLFVALSLALNYYLTKMLGVKGPAYGTLIAICFFNIIRFIAIWKIYHLQPFTNQHAKIVGIAVACIFIAWWIPDLGNLYVNVAVPTLIFLLAYGLSVIYLNISPDINELMANIRKRFSEFGN